MTLRMLTGALLALALAAAPALPLGAQEIVDATERQIVDEISGRVEHLNDEMRTLSIAGLVLRVPTGVEAYEDLLAGDEIVVSYYVDQNGDKVVDELVAIGEH